MTQRRSRNRLRLPWALLAVPTAAGVPTGVLWWLLAPGGLNLATRDPALADGRNPDVWFPRDLTLAALFLFGGCLLAVFLMDKRRADPQAALVMGLAGALFGGLVAWQAGLLSGQLWGPAVDASPNPSIAFSLRSFPVLLLWPAATAAACFVLELMNQLGRKPGPEGPADHARLRPVK